MGAPSGRALPTSQSNSPRIFALLLGALAPLSPLPAAPAAPAESAEIVPLASRSLLLAIASAGPRLVAVGDRGHILTSDDQGKSWQQRPVPTRAMLTGVSFPSANLGWAVGHDGVILHTTDGGNTWSRQDKGDDLETVFLDVLFLDDAHGFAVGAYGKFLHTGDGGKTWERASPSDADIHYNRIAAGPDGRLWLCGEGGSLLLSPDSGQTWTALTVPYDGSLFGYVPIGAEAGVVHGLRGHIFTTTNSGEQWAPVGSDLKALIMAGQRLRSGTILLGGQGGNFFVSRDEGATFTPWQPAGFGTSVAALIEAADGAIIAVGEAGATRLTLPAP